MELGATYATPVERCRAGSQIRAVPGSGSWQAPYHPRSGRPSVAGMTNERPIEPTARDLARLVGEIRRYLAAVEEFRRLGCEPRWRPEAVGS